MEGAESDAGAYRKQWRASGQRALRQERSLPLRETVSDIHAAKRRLGHDPGRRECWHSDLHTAQPGLDLDLGVPRERTAEVELVAGGSSGEPHLREVGVGEVIGVAVGDGSATLRTTLFAL